MAKAAKRRRRRTRRAGARRPPEAPPKPGPGRVRGLHAAVAALLHAEEAAGRPWRLLPWILLLAFAARAAIALSGDFVLHPDEIMQYLEPAHRLVFGNGVAYWEYFYGARAWLVPGLVAGVLGTFDGLGLGEPAWYVAGVKLVFCAVSLAVPAGMYLFARGHFGETAARAALVAGAFWYELAGFAHKPMAEFVATAALLPLLALAGRAAEPAARTGWAAGLAAVTVAAVRPQYAPLALVLLTVVFLRTRRRLELVLATAGLALAVGIVDALAWDRGLFHSYVTNVRFNLVLGELRVGESPPWQFLEWLAVASAGAGLAGLAVAARWPRRYGLLLALAGLLLLAHSLQPHKEYRFVFAVVPFWLLVAADLLVRAWRTDATRRAVAGLAVLGLAAASVAGLLNALPLQHRLHEAWSQETGKVGFLHGRDPIFAAYRDLARMPDVKAVWQVDRHYHNSPGYYYLHRRIPFYDALTAPALLQDVPLTDAVSHVVSSDPDLAVPGYRVVRAYGNLRILARQRPDAPVRQWRDYAPVVVDRFTAGLMRRIDPRAAEPAADMNIRLEGISPATPDRP